MNKSQVYIYRLPLGSETPLESETELKSIISQVLYENGINRYSIMSIRTLLSISKWTALTSNLSSQVDILDKKVCDFF